MLIKPQLPAQFTGIDIETKSTKLMGYILSFGMCKINMRKFKPDEVVGFELEPNNKEADEIFHTDPGTMRWWDKAGTPEADQFSPCEVAKLRAFNGTIPHRDGIKTLHRMLHSQSKDNVVFTSRGPEFDMRIIEQSCLAYGFDWKMRFGNFDSDRTYERVGKALGIKMPSEAFVEAYMGRKFIKHCAQCDAGFEAYNGARVLWLNVIMSLDGRDKMIEELKNMDEGKFDPSPYVERVEFV